MASFDTETCDTSLVQKCNTCKAAFSSVERVKVKSYYYLLLL